VYRNGESVDDRIAEPIAMLIADVASITSACQALSSGPFEDYVHLRVTTIDIPVALYISE
jgi:hypothetical protein